MISLSVVIVNFNSGQWLKKCIDALLSSDYPIKEMIVVDNASTDESTCFIEEYNKNYKHIIFHPCYQNMGYSEGNNIGVGISSGEWILILNPDAIVLNNTISQLVEKYQSLQNNQLILAPQILNIDGSHQVSCWNFITTLDILKECLFLNYIFPSQSKQCDEVLCPCEVVSGAAFLISKKRWQDLCGLDTNLFWVEDVDLCYRNMKSGGNNYMFKSAQMYHFIGGSSEKNKDKVIANQIFSRLKFFSKHSSQLNLVAVYFLLTLLCIDRWLLFFILSIFNNKLAVKRKGYALAFKNMIKWLYTNDKRIII